MPPQYQQPPSQVGGKASELTTRSQNCFAVHFYYQPRLLSRLDYEDLHSGFTLSSSIPIPIS